MTEATRDRVLSAIVSITADRGLAHASIREVALKAGVSIGSVQYYCRTKDEMLVLAFRHVMERITARASGRVRRGRVGPALRAFAHEFLPLDEERRRESRVYLAFAARAAVEANLGEVQRELLGGLRRRCSDAFRLARERGEAVGEFDPAEAAAATTALIDGLVLHLLSDPHGLPKAVALRALDSHLSRFLEM